MKVTSRSGVSQRRLAETEHATPCSLDFAGWKLTGSGVGIRVSQLPTCVVLSLLHLVQQMGAFGLCLTPVQAALPPPFRSQFAEIKNVLTLRKFAEAHENSFTKSHAGFGESSQVDR